MKYSICIFLLFLSPLFAQQRLPVIPGSVFSLPGIEFTDVQKQTIEKLKSKFGPAWTAQQNKRTAIYNKEQNQARKEAFLAARASGTKGQALWDSVNAAMNITREQKQKLNQIQTARKELQQNIRKELVKLLNEDQQKKFRAGNPDSPRQANRSRPTHPDIMYGPHDRNVMDVWLAKSEKPTPVLVSIHGGGFRAGRKGIQGELLKHCLDNGISVVAITYRFSQDAIAPASFHDSARAVQFIRHKAKEWNIDPARFAATGGSAGAGISLWLGFHDDRADPNHSDPVLRQSTRLSGMAVFNGQTSYDPRFIRKLFPESDTYKHSALAQLYDVNLDRLDELPKEKYALFEAVSALPHLTKDDPPALLFYGSEMDTKVTNHSIGIHHPRFGQALKKEMDKLNIPCDVHTRIRKSGKNQTDIMMEFLFGRFGMPPK